MNGAVTMELNEILTFAEKAGASDVHLKVGLPPLFRIDGSLFPLRDVERLTPEDTYRMSHSIMTAEQQQEFARTHDADFAHAIRGHGRFRVNVFMQRQFIGMVLRTIPATVPHISKLHLPKVVEKIALERRGLILVTGTTGSGKSTTMAAMIDYINTQRSAHIMTIEDPIEFVFRDKRSLINQREVGVDTASFAQGLRAALRQDPDVILVGEMRDPDTIQTALTAAETGHLVISTLHTLDASETVNRIVMSFPPHQQQQIRLLLASVLTAVISQRLVPRADKKGRVPAMEIMRNTGRVSELIEDPARTRELHDAIARGQMEYEMQTFDQSLYDLVKQKLVTVEEAMHQSSNPDDFALRLSGISSSDDWDVMGEDGAEPDLSALNTEKLSNGRPNRRQPT